MLEHLLDWLLIVGLPWPIAVAIANHRRRKTRSPLAALARIHRHN